jgi:Glycosyl transferases group 1
LSHLIFCSIELGAIPYLIADLLNRHGIETYYVSLARHVPHDSTEFQLGISRAKWDLSSMFDDVWSRKTFGTNPMRVDGHSKHSRFSFLGRPTEALLRTSGSAIADALRDRYHRADVIRVLGNIKANYRISNCLAVGTKAYLLKEAGINYKYWSHGSDLDRFCFPEISFLRLEPVWVKTAKYLFHTMTDAIEARQSVRQADGVMIAPYQVGSYNRLFPGKKLFFFPHFFSVLDYEELRHQKVSSRKSVCEELKAQHYFFSSSRHFWSGANGRMPHHKGNNVALLAFAKYLEMTGDKGAKLVLIDKGPDVDATKLLAQELSVDHSIAWIQPMPRSDLERLYQGASGCFGQFGTPVLTFAALEPLANGNVCISYFGEQSTEVPFYEDMPPVFNSKDFSQIAKFMSHIQSDPGYYAELCYESWLWVKRRCSEEKFVSSFLEIFDQSSPKEESTRSTDDGVSPF